MQVTLRWGGKSRGREKGNRQGVASSKVTGEEENADWGTRWERGSGQWRSATEVARERMQRKRNWAAIAEWERYRRRGGETKLEREIDAVCDGQARECCGKQGG